MSEPADILWRRRQALLDNGDPFLSSAPMGMAPDLGNGALSDNKPPTPAPSFLRSLISHIGGSGNQGLLLRENPGAAPSVAPYEAIKGAVGKAAAGADPSELVPDVTDAALSIGVGGSAMPRQAGSLGTFLGMRQAQHLAAQGRPAALDALRVAEIMENRGASHQAIRDTAHQIFQAAGEKNFGTLWKPSPQDEWRFEIADKPAKLAKLGPEGWPELAPLQGQYTHPDLFAAEPGIEQTELRRNLPNPSLPNRPLVYHDPSGYGVPSEIGINDTQLPYRQRGKDTRQADIAAELQHEIQYRNDWPRGGRPAEFAPGGALAHYVLPGETPEQAYGRLLGERESKVVKARAKLKPEDLQKIPVEKTILELQKAVPPLLPSRGGLIREGYNGGLFPSLEDPPAAKPPSALQREQLARQDQLGRNADEVAKQAQAVVDLFKTLGTPHAEIAKTLEDKFGVPVDAEHVRTGQGWWNVPAAGSRQFMTADQRALFTKLHSEGVTYAEMARQLRKIGWDTNEGALRDMARYLGFPPRPRGGAARGRPPITWKR